MTDTIEHRMAQFAENGDAQEIQWTEQGLVLSGLMLRTFHGDTAAENALKSLYGDLCEADEFLYYAPGDWSELTPSKLRQFPLYRQLRNLRAYGCFGLPVEACAGLEEVPNDVAIGEVPDDPDRRWQCITALVERYSHQVYDGQLALPIAPEMLFGPAFKTAAFAASGRWKIDSGDRNQRVLPEEVAALANIIPKTVKNAMAPKSNERLRTHADGKTVSIGSAAEWLAHRRDFRSSIWHMRARADAPSRGHAPDLFDEVLFLPVTDDGSFFAPETTVGGRYRVGVDPEAETFDDYRRAVARLQHMAVPKWQEEDPNDRRIKERTGRDWKRFNTVEIGLDAAARHVPAS